MTRSACRPPTDFLDDDRWSAIWAHHDELIALARHRVPSEFDAEDVVHEALALAAENPNVELARAGAWLNRVVRNRCADLARERSYADKKVVYERGLARVQPLTEDLVCDTAEALFLGRVAGTLPSRQHEALIHASRGLSNAQIAAAMSTTVKAIESLLVKARRTLRAAAAAVVIGFAWMMRRRMASSTTAVGLAALSISVGVLILPMTRPAAPALSPAHVSVRDDTATHSTRTATGPTPQHAVVAAPAQVSRHRSAGSPHWTQQPHRVDVAVSVGPHHRGAEVSFLQYGNAATPAVMACVRKGVEVSLEYVGCKAFK